MDNNLSENLADKVKDWLEGFGYSLEMRVAPAFKDAGFEISQFEHYIDQESQSVGPIDVFASLSRDIGKTFFQIRLVIECKYSKTSPWIILITSKRTDKFVLFSRLLRNKHPSRWKNIETLQGRLLARILMALEDDKLSKFAIQKTGYVVMETLKTNQDPKRRDNAYEATTQVNKSIESLGVENDNIYRQTIKDHENYLEKNPTDFALPLLLNILIPVVVINGQLFEGYLDSENQIQVAEIDQGTVFVTYRRHETHSDAQVLLSPVLIVTELHLSDFIKDMHESIEDLLSKNEVIEDLIKFEISQIHPITRQSDDF